MKLRMPFDNTTKAEARQPEPSAELQPKKSLRTMQLWSPADNEEAPDHFECCSVRS